MKKACFTIFFIVMTLLVFAEETRIVPQETIDAIAKRNAKSIWGDVYADAPIPCYDRDGKIVAWQYNFRIGSPFPAREELMAQCRGEQDALWNSDWNEEEYAQMELGARTDKPVIWGYSNGLSYDYAYYPVMERMVRKKFGESLSLVRMVYVNFASRWFVMTDGTEEWYVKAYAPPKILKRDEFLAATDSLETPLIPIDFTDDWTAYENGRTQDRAFTYIPNHIMMPFYQWCYGCSPCSASMIFGYWDANSINGPNYSLLVDYHWGMWDDIEDHYDYHVPNVCAELADAMDTDSEGSTYQGDIDNGMEEVLEDNGYDAWCYNNYIGWEYLWDYYDMFDEIADEIDDGYPTHLSIPDHSIVGMGYNSNTYDIAIHDPNYSTIQNRFISDFERVGQVHPHEPFGVPLNLVSPHGGMNWHANTNFEVWKAGDMYEIVWNTETEPGIYAKIWYSTEAGTGHVTDDWNLIESSTANDGSYNWHIPPGIQSTECRVRVEAFSAGHQMIASDGSYGDFTINSGGSINDLTSGISEMTDRYPDYFTFSQAENRWAVIAGRKGTDLPSCNLILYDSDDINTSLAISNDLGKVNLIAIDRNHLDYTEYAVKVYRAEGDYSSRIEYEGEDDELIVGTNPTMGWSTSNVAKMWDVQLTPGVYSIKLDMLSGSADLNIGLFSSQGGNFYRPMGDAIAIGNTNGNGADEDITVNITASDRYGLCVWSNNFATAAYRIDFGYPGEWTGTISSSWTNPSNWGNNQVPDRYRDVVIPCGTAHSPQITTGVNASVKSLTLESGASLSVDSGTLNVYGSAYLDGAMNVDTDGAVVNFYGHVQVQEHAQLTDGGDVTLNVCGNWTAFEGCLVDLDQGTVNFPGNESAILTVNSDTHAFYNLEVAKDPGEEVVLSGDSEESLNIGHNLTCSEGCYFRVQTDYPVYLSGSVSSEGGIRFETGELVFNRDGPQVLFVTADDVFYNITIQSESELNITGNTTITGNLNINGGILHTYGRTITIEGDWLNNSGILYGEDSPIVFCNDSNDQYVNEDGFDILRLEKNGSGKLIIGPDASVICQRYDWTAGSISVYGGGSFTALDLLDTRVMGRYYLDGGTIDLHQGTSSTEYVDLDADIWIYDGTMRIHGGYGFPSEWAYTRSITIYMEGGVLDFVDNGIFVSDTGHYLNDIITGGTIRTSGDFMIEHAGFNPAGGEIELYGPGTAYLYNYSESSFHDVRINKSSTRDQNEREDRINRVIVNQNTTVDGDFLNDDGLLQIDGATLDIGGDLDIYYGINMDASDETITVGGDVDWKDGSSCTITAGEFHVDGDWAFSTGTNAQLGVASTVYFEGSENMRIYAYDIDARFGKVVFDKSAGDCEIFISSTHSNTLNVGDELEIRGGNSLDVNSATLNVSSAIDIYDSGQMSLSDGGAITASELFLSGDFNQVGGDVTISDDFIQYASGNLEIEDGSFIIDSPYTGSYESFGGTTTISGGVFQITNNGMQVGSGFTVGNAIVKLGWGLCAVQDNTLQLDHGSIEFIGNRSATVQLAPTNYLHSMTVSKTGASGFVYLAGDLHLTEDLIIDSGNVSCNHHTLTVDRDFNNSLTGVLDVSNADDEIRVGRHWNNEHGPAGFIEGLGKVTFFSYFGAEIVYDEEFYNLEMDKPLASMYYLSIPTGNNLTVAGDFDLTHGKLLLRASSTLNVAGNTTLSNDSKLWCYFMEANMEALLYGDLTVGTDAEVAVNLGSMEIAGDLDLDGSLVVGDGQLQLHGGFVNSASSTVSIADGDFLCDAPYTGQWQNIYGTLEMTGENGSFSFPNRGLQFVSTFNDLISSGTIQIGRGFYAATSSVFQPSGGTVMFTGDQNGSILCSGGNCLNNLTIAKDGITMSLSSDLDLSGDLTIQSGALNGGSRTILVGGSWQNTVGTAGFMENSSTVYFQGSEAEEIIGDETFYNVTVDRDLMPDVFLHSTGTIAVNNDLNLISGILDLDETANWTVTGDIVIYNGACLDFADVAGSPMITLTGSLTDFNTIIDGMHGFNTDGNCSMILDGTGDQIISTVVSPVQLWNFTLTGDCYFYPSVSFDIRGSLHLAGNSSWDYGSGGMTHRIGGDFIIDPTANWFDNTGTVVLGGSADAELGIQGDVYFENITIDKSSTLREAPYVTLTADLDMDGGGQLTVQSGVLDIEDYSLTTNGDIVIGDGGKLSVSSGGSVQLSSSNTFDINNGGILEAIGTSGDPVLIGSTDSGFYAFNVNSGGTLVAEYAIFEYMDANGVNVHGGATIDPDHSLDHCTFRNGSAGGTLLTVNNDQYIEVVGAEFPANTWFGTFNVAKTVDDGGVTFTGESGDFAGSYHEYDGFERINWSGDVPTIQVSTNLLEFGEVAIGSETTLDLIINNYGTANLVGTLVTPEGYYAEIIAIRENATLTSSARRETRSRDGGSRNALDFTVLPYSSKHIRVHFNPMDAGDFSGNIVISHNAGGGDVLVQCTGAGIGARLNASPGSFNAELLPGASSSRTLTIENTGNLELEYTASVMMWGRPDEPFAWLTIEGDSLVSGAIPAGGSADVWNVLLDSGELTEGWYMGQIQISSNDPVDPMHYITVGMVIGTPVMTVDPDSLTFGYIRVGNSTDRTFTVYNSGAITLNGTITMPEGFIVDTLQTIRRDPARNVLDFTVSSYISKTFNVTFAPETGQSYDSFATITSNAGNEQIPLYADGYDYPIVQTVAVDDDHSTYAGVTGNVVSDGNFLFYRRGFCWNTVGNPTVENDTLVVTGTTGVYSADITSLTYDTEYHVRAFAVNMLGIAYGEEMSFTTRTPVITVSDTLLADFGEVVVGNESPEQTFTVSGEYLCESIEIAAPIDFEVSLTSWAERSRTSRQRVTRSVMLDPVDETVPETTIFVRFTPGSAMDVSNLVNLSSTGAEFREIAVSGTGIQLADIMTNPVIDIGYETASCGGLILNDGNSQINAYGLCWNTTGSPTTSDPHTSEELPAADFTSQMTGLVPDMTYFVRVYAVNGAGVAYGIETSFDTNPQPDIVVSETGLPDFGHVPAGTQSASQTFTVSGTNLVDDIVITLSDGFVIASSETRNGRLFGDTIVLSPTGGTISDTTLYARFAPSHGGTFTGALELVSTGAESEGIDLSGTGITMPSVVTAEISGILPESATGGGTILDDGWDSVSACGVCWSVLPDPTLDDSYTDEGALTGAFVSAINGLAPNTIYFVRAYATNAAGTAYGESISFTSGIASLASPSNVTIQNVDDDIVLTWDAVDGAESYHIYRSDSPNPIDWGDPVMTVDTCEFVDHDALLNSSGFYRITANTEPIEVRR